MICKREYILRDQASKIYKGDAVRTNTFIPKSKYTGLLVAHENSKLENYRVSVKRTNK